MSSCIAHVFEEQGITWIRTQIVYLLFFPYNTKVPNYDGFDRGWNIS